MASNTDPEFPTFFDQKTCVRRGLYLHFHNATHIVLTISRFQAWFQSPRTPCSRLRATIYTTVSAYLFWKNHIFSAVLTIEQHGTGPEKIIFIMGFVTSLIRPSLTLTRTRTLFSLNNSSFGWYRQVEHFANLDKYSLVVFDNRGVGNSDCPSGRYTYALTLLSVLICSNLTVML